MISVDIDTRELDRYRERLGLYMQLNRRDVKELVRRKGNDLRIALYREYRRFAPDPGESILEAKARSWRVRRRGVGISPAARKRAAAKLGGHQSILVSDVRESVSKAGTRTIRLTGVRQTKRGQRTTGGRSNRGGRAVSGLDALIREPGDIVLNRRAVEVVEEVNLREKARVAAATGWLAGRRSEAEGAWRQRPRVRPQSHRDHAGRDGFHRRRRRGPHLVH